MVTNKLFVYGTLMGNFDSPIARSLQQHSNFLGEGLLRGRLFDLGHYPGAVYEADAQTWVKGHIFQLHQPETLFPLLDNYEGIGGNFPSPNEYTRSLVPVLQTGQTLICYCYVYNLSTAPLTCITSGSYLEYLSIGR
ncbi:MAG: gamma-glutamylcyclotransferase [Saprospiraceae bacterium]|nr:gamma-glutamylcyclotransferase [Saprospiraceae bacterium]